jgi:uncharacterized repeat protein (TIGR04076 family)
MKGAFQMSSEMPKCKITVLKRTINQDLIDEYLEDSCQDIGLCECFEEGQEFVIDPSALPGDFFARCAWAWADIGRDILTVAYGGDMPGMRQRGTVITGCRDWFRPVIFKVERMEND